MSKTEDTQEIFGSFILNSSEFALPVKSIQEVVNPPDKFTAMPLAPSFLLGFFNLRGAIIPVIDLKSILKMEPDGQPLKNKKIAIVDHERVKVGLLFDQTAEIFRSRVDEISEFQYSGSETKQNVISGAIKRDEGKRIIQVLDSSALITLERVPRSSEGSSETSRFQRQLIHKGNRKQCISFLVGNSRCCFGIEAIHEIIKAPKLNETVFASGNCIGMFDLRGDVVPVVDFASLLKYRVPQDRKSISEDQRVIVMKIGAEKFGLLIDAVESIVTYYSDELLSLPMVTQERSSMFMGCLSRADMGDIILLNHDEVLSSAEINEITRGHSKIYQTSSSKGTQSSEKRGRRKSYITFRIDHLFGLGIEEVREVIDFPKEVLRPPGLPKYIRGMTNVRGQLVTILDTRALYGIEEQCTTETAKLMIFERRGVTYGMIVDSVESIASFSDDEVMRLPEVLYRTQGTKGIEEDVRFAVEIEVSGSKKALLVLNLDPLAERAGLSNSANPASLAKQTA